MIAIALIVLAVLAYLGRSLVMLTSVGGMAIAIWWAQGRPAHVQVTALILGAVGSSMLAEVVHLLHHVALDDSPDHGGFWLSAFLVGLINALAMLPVLGAAHLWRQRRSQAG